MILNKAQRRKRKVVIQGGAGREKELTCGKGGLDALMACPESTVKVDLVSRLRAYEVDLICLWLARNLL
jgi:hypothetical protein